MRPAADQVQVSNQPSKLGLEDEPPAIFFGSSVAKIKMSFAIDLQFETVRRVSDHVASASALCIAFFRKPHGQIVNIVLADVASPPAPRVRNFAANRNSSKRLRTWQSSNKQRKLRLILQVKSLQTFAIAKLPRMLPGAWSVLCFKHGSNPSPPARTFGSQNSACLKKLPHDGT
jgi:hypothetical protein